MTHEWTSFALLWRQLKRKKRQGLLASRRILCIIHAYYPEFLQGIADAVANVGLCEVVVTYSNENVISELNRLFPQAKLVRCENVGFDIWPFLKILNVIDLDDYDYIVKLHTKRNFNYKLRTNHSDYSGKNWRNYLLSFINTKHAWEQSLRLLQDDRTVGMVAGLRCILRRKDTPWFDGATGFDKGLKIAGECGIKTKHPHFVGGTMFVARSEVFKPLQGRFSAEDFPASVTHATSTLGHYLERTIGFAASTAQYRIADPADSVRLFHRRNDFFDWVMSFLNFIFRVKKQENGTIIVKLLKIPICRIGNILSNRCDNANCVFVNRDFNAFIEHWDYTDKRWFVFMRHPVEFLHPLGAYLDKVNDCNCLYGINSSNNHYEGSVPSPQRSLLTKNIDERILIVNSRLVSDFRLRFDESDSSMAICRLVKTAFDDYGIHTRRLGIKVKVSGPAVEGGNEK